MYNTNLAYKERTYYELIDGRLVAMSPSPTTYHGNAAANILGMFWSYLRGKRCRVFGDSLTVFLTEKDHFVPDCMVVCDRSKIKKDGIHGAPDLVVEVLSPGTAKNDRFYKKDTYEKCGVKEYWIVSPIEAAIEAYHLKDGIFVPDNVYTYCPPDEWEKLDGNDRAKLPQGFKCSLFDDLNIALEDIFGDVDW